MDRMFGYSMLVGAWIGGILGVFAGAAVKNTSLGIGLGALGGLFVGWLVAAVARQVRRGHEKHDRR